MRRTGVHQRGDHAVRDGVICGIDHEGGAGKNERPLRPAIIGMAADLKCLTPLKIMGSRLFLPAALKEDDFTSKATNKCLSNQGGRIIIE